MTLDTSPDAGGAGNRLGHQPGDAGSKLHGVLDLTQAHPLHAAMAGLPPGHPIILDAGEVERMSTPCAQVILAAARSAVAAGVSFKIRNASAVFRTAIADLGLQPEFSNWMD